MVLLPRMYFTHIGFVQGRTSRSPPPHTDTTPHTSYPRPYTPHWCIFTSALCATQAIDEHVDTRRKRRREEAHVEAMKKEREERPKISDQFADLKVRRCGGLLLCVAVCARSMVVLARLERPRIPPPLGLFD